MQVKKILTYKEPEYLYRKLKENNMKHTYGLRQPRDEIQIKETILQMAQSSFLWRGAKSYTNLPDTLRNEPLNSFQKQVRRWVLDNVPI